MPPVGHRRQIRTVAVSYTHLDVYKRQDLQLLGLGHNGHIGFNEPEDTFPKLTHCVDLQESNIEATKRFFADINDLSLIHI